MAASPLARSVGVVAVVAALIAGAGALQWVRESRYPSPPVTETSLYLTSGPAVRRLTTGYNALAADLYWIRAIQYYGDEKIRLGRSDQERARGTAGPGGYQLLYPLLDLTTTLDPRFNI